ncbi:MAG: tetratricopeptide repeat-containing sensor histidine kinase [Flammeovirgaceae bacterium]
MMIRHLRIAKYIFILFLPFFCSQLQAQDSFDQQINQATLDSINKWEEQLSTAPTLKAELDLLYKLIAIHYKVPGNYPKVRSYSSMLRRKSKNHDESLYQYAISVLGQMQYVNGNEEKAFTYFDSLADKNVNPAIKIKSYINLSKFFLYEEEPEHSLLFANKSKIIADSLEDNNSIVKSLLLIAKAQRKQGNSQESIKVLFDALKMDSSNIEIMNNLAISFGRINDDQSSVFFFQKAFEQALKQENIEGQIVLSGNVASIYLTEEKFDSALFFINKSLEIVDNSSYETASSSMAIYKPGIFIITSEIYLGLKEFKKAETYANKALNAVKKYRGIGKSDEVAIMLQVARIKQGVQSYREAYHILDRLLKNNVVVENSPFYKAEIYLMMSEIQDALNKWKSAYELRLLYDALNDSLRNENVQKEVAALKEKYEAEEKEHQIAMLEQQGLIQEANIEKQRVYNKALVILIIIIFLIAGIIFYAKQKLSKANKTIQEQNNELYDANESLALLNHEKDELMGIVAHDLRSPLHHIDILLTKYIHELPHNFMRLIKNETFRGNEMIKDILLFYEIENLEDEIILEKTDLNQVIDEVILLYQERIAAKGINLMTDVLDSEIYVKSNPVYLKRIVENLISNAIKFTYPDSNVFVKVHQQDGNAVLEIEDEGPGFSEYDKKRLFKKFGRLSARPTAGEPSFGLGLASVKILSQKLKAKVEPVFSSADHKGGCVRLQLTVA